MASSNLFHRRTHSLTRHPNSDDKTAAGVGDAKSSARVLPCACLFVRSFVLPLLDTLFLPAPRRETRFTAFVTGSPSDNHKMITSGRGTATLHSNLCYTAISHCGTELLTSASCNVFFTLFHCCSVWMAVSLPIPHRRRPLTFFCASFLSGGGESLTVSPPSPSSLLLISLPSDLPEEAASGSLRCGRPA